MRKAGNNCNRLGILVCQILDDGSGGSSCSQDDAVPPGNSDTGLFQRPAKSAVIGIISERSFICKMNGIDGPDNPCFPGYIRQIGHNISFIRNSDVATCIPILCQIFHIPFQLVRGHFQYIIRSGYPHGPINFFMDSRGCRMAQCFSYKACFHRILPPLSDG